VLPQRGICAVMANDWLAKARANVLNATPRHRRGLTA
jgi:hypothetical protein